MATATPVHRICEKVRRLLAAGELKPVEIAEVVGCPVSTVYDVRKRQNRTSRAAWVNQQFVALERRMANLERTVHTANERITALETKPAKTRR